MAIRYAVASGNWSNTATWDGGTLPAAGDDVRSNGFTVTVDGMYTALTVSNRAETSPTVSAGGTFLLNDGSSVTATDPTNGFPLSGTSGHATFTHNLTNGQSATLTGTHVHVAPANIGARLCNVTGAGTLVFVGDSTSMDSGTGGNSIFVTGASAIVSVTGNCSSTGGGSAGFVNIQAANVTVNWTGNITASGTAHTATAIGGGIAVGNVSGAIVNVTGALTGNARAPAIGTNASTNMTITVIGQMNAGSAYPAVSIINYTNNRLILSGPFVSNRNGTMPFHAPNVIWIGAPSGTYLSIATNDLLATRTLYTADYTSALHMPAIADVRSGTVYGPASELTGTCAVPPAGSVALGVPVDATTGTAALTQQAIADAVGPLIAAYGA